MADSDVFLYIGLTALVLFIIQTAISFLAGHGDGGDGGHDGHMVVDHDHDGGHHDGDGHDHDNPLGFLRFFTLRNMVAFAMGYGWVGYASVKTRLPDLVAVLLGIAAGIFFVYAIYKLMRALHGLESDATARLEDAIGQIGEVYLEVGDESPGKVTILLGGAKQELPAIHGHPGTLKRGTPVRVVDYDGNFLLVERS